MKPDAEKSLGQLEILARKSRAEMLSLRLKCEKLEAENKELKKDLDYFQELAGDQELQIHALEIHDIKDLKDEVERLKYELELAVKLLETK